jgi:DNA mismatch repair protein MSH6
MLDSLLDERKDAANIRLGHMECLVENGDVTSSSNELDESTITFLYTLGEGVCPKSFGINVARLAGLPEDVLSNARRIFCEFEQEMNNDGTRSRVVTARSVPSQKSQIVDAIRSGKTADVARLWQSLQG